jgi:hypothetical protein
MLKCHFVTDSIVLFLQQVLLKPGVAELQLEGDASRDDDEIPKGGNGLLNFCKFCFWIVSIAYIFW